MSPYTRHAPHIRRSPCQVTAALAVLTTSPSLLPVNRVSYLGPPYDASIELQPAVPRTSRLPTMPLDSNNFGVDTRAGGCHGKKQGAVGDGAEPCRKPAARKAGRPPPQRMENARIGNSPSPKQLRLLRHVQKLDRQTLDWTPPALSPETHINPTLAP